MNAYAIIEKIEGKEAADGFKEYMLKLNLKPEIREKVEAFDLMNPLHKHGFHPALILHMMEYNKKLTTESI